MLPGDGSLSSPTLYATMHGNCLISGQDLILSQNIRGSAYSNTWVHGASRRVLQDCPKELQEEPKRSQEEFKTTTTAHKSTPIATQDAS
eukprot:8372380-Pyramimonas_sp.AAC.1